MLDSALVAVHVWSVFWLVAGLVGRDASYWQAARASELSPLRTLAGMGGHFDRTMVRPATFVVLITGLISAQVRGWPIFGFLQGGGINWVLAALLVYLSSIPLIFLVFLPKGRVYRAELAAADERGEVTPALRASLRDPLVGAARGYELAMVAALAWLMIAKPF